MDINGIKVTQDPVTGEVTVVVGAYQIEVWKTEDSNKPSLTLICYQGEDLDDCRSVDMLMSCRGRKWCFSADGRKLEFEQ